MCRIFIISFFWIFLSGCKGYYMFKTTPQWWQSKHEVIATVISVLHQPETGFRYEFYVEGKRYEGGYSFYENNDGVVVGTKYKVAYNPSDPTQNHIQLHTQLFEDFETVGYSLGKVGPSIGIIQDERDSLEIIRLRFSFWVKEKRYRGVRNYIVNSYGYLPKDIEGKTFKVKYWVENPYRSIILLDELVIE